MDNYVITASDGSRWLVEDCYSPIEANDRAAIFLTARIVSIDRIPRGPEGDALTDSLYDSGRIIQG